MSTYNPAAILRILGGKQERLHGEAWDALRAKVWIEVTQGCNGSNAPERRRLRDEWEAKDARAYAMYDVIHFLRDEVERVSNEVS